MSADDRQVGGAHYKSEYQHWTLVLRVGMGYLEGNATKYVARWRKKNGRADLEKALHYVEKLQESAHLLKQPRPLPLHPASIRSDVHQFAEANGLTPLEERAIADIAVWQYVGDLAEVPDMIRTLLAGEKKAEEPPLADPAPVPGMEENHYAERAPIKNDTRRRWPIGMNKTTRDDAPERIRSLYDWDGNRGEWMMKPEYRDAFALGFGDEDKERT